MMRSIAILLFGALAVNGFPNFQTYGNQGMQNFAAMNMFRDDDYRSYGSSNGFYGDDDNRYGATIMRSLSNGFTPVTSSSNHLFGNQAHHSSNRGIQSQSTVNTRARNQPTVRSNQHINSRTSTPSYNRGSNSLQTSSFLPRRTMHFTPSYFRQDTDDSFFSDVSDNMGGYISGINRGWGSNRFNAGNAMGASMYGGNFYDDDQFRTGMFQGFNF